MELRLILLLALLFSLSDVAEAQKKEKKDATFCVEMSCENCKAKVEKNIAYEKGVQDLKVDLKEKTVKVSYDASKTDAKKLLTAIKKLGFEAKEVEPKAEKK